MEIEEKLKKIDEALGRGVGELIDPDNKFRQKLEAKARGEYPKDIIIKFGVDPTRPDIHLGHAVILRRLRAFQDIGCKVVFLVGDFTARIGDPTGKNKARPEVEQAEIEKNMMTYLEQIDKVIKTSSECFSWIRNSDWFLNVTDIDPKPGSFVRFKTAFVNPASFIGKAVLYHETRMQNTHLKKPVVISVSLLGLLNTLRHITHSRLIERDMFKKRIEREEELYMHEMLYPVLQGIDSHVLHLIYGSCDLEVGGTDQTFNMLIGRDVMKMHEQEPQAVVSYKLLEGTDGKEKMSKSLDNYIGITDAPSDMFGKVMSIPDSSILNYFELVTYTPYDRIEEMRRALSKGDINPIDYKMELAEQVVTLYHGSQSAMKAKEDFVNTFNKGGIPADIETKKVQKGANLSDALIECRVVASKSEFRRLIDDGAVKDVINGENIGDPYYTVNESVVLKVGKRRFIKIEVE